MTITPEMDEDEITLSTGKTFYANKGIVGLGTDGDVYGGYDGVVGVVFTMEERWELAGMMIKRWLEWASQHENKE